MCIPYKVGAIRITLITHIMRKGLCENMGRIDVILPEDLEQKFRMEAGRRLGAKRGAFTEAVIDALKDWADPDLAQVIVEYKAKHGGKKK